MRGHGLDPSAVTSSAGSTQRRSMVLAGPDFPFKESTIPGHSHEQGTLAIHPCRSRSSQVAHPSHNCAASMWPGGCLICCTWYQHPMSRPGDCAVQKGQQFAAVGLSPCQGSHCQVGTLQAWSLAATRRTRSPRSPPSTQRQRRSDLDSCSDGEVSHAGGCDEA
jgi:hypothetical protein